MRMLGLFRENTDVVADFNINVLDPTSAMYSLYDWNDNIIASDIAVEISFDNIIRITIPSSYNNLSNNNQKEMRKIELKTFGASGEIYSESAIYLIQANTILSVPSDSFVTSHEATLLAFDLFGCENFINLDDIKKRQLLISATKKIKRLSFSYQKIMGWYNIGLDDYPQDRLNTNNLPFSVRNDTLDFDEMTDTEFNDLPITFRSALAEACILEANALCFKNDVEDARRLGITSETIGEVSLTLKSGVVKTNDYDKSTLDVLNKYLRRIRVVRRG